MIMQIETKQTVNGKRNHDGAYYLRGLLCLLSLLLLSSAAFGQGAPTPLYEAPTRLVIKSEVLGEERIVLIRTPFGYERNGQRYPVLYMTDGDAHIQHTSSTIEFLARNGRMPEMIIVAITNTDRGRDLTPTRANVTRPDGKLQFPTSGGADKFIKFIEAELMPAIEAKYRVQPYRMLAGHSLGGLFAVHVMMSRPELFNSYIAVSPSLQWDDQMMIKRAEQFLTNRKEFKKTLFLTLGNEQGGIAASFKTFKELLGRYKPEGFVWEAVQMEDEDHNSVVLRSHYLGMRKEFDGWQLPREPATGLVIGGLKGADEHYRKLSQKLGYTLAVPEGLVNQIGYQLMGTGKLEEAIAAFKSNTERYPASANVYDSLAEAYERSNQLDLARQNYEKAYTISKEVGSPNLEIFKTNLERVNGKLKQKGSTPGQ
jgi:predicted alpha/beta superfamily hydrolase